MFGAPRLRVIDELDRYANDLTSITGPYNERVQSAFNYNLSGIGEISTKNYEGNYRALLEKYCRAYDGEGKTTYHMRDLTIEEALDVADILSTLRSDLCLERGYGI